MTDRMPSQKIVIIGGVAGGATAAARIRRLDEHAEIVVLERGKHISFANCGLPYYISGKILHKSKLTLQSPKSFKDRFNIDVRIQSEAVLINREKKLITVSNLASGEVYVESYDKLLIATGAKPNMPTIPASIEDQVFTLRNIPDMDRILRYIDTRRPRSAVIIGSGLIGLEIAESLHAHHIDITLVDRLNQVLPAIDYDVAAEVKQYIEKLGMKVLLSEKVQAVSATENGLTLQLSQSVIDAEMVIFASGVIPESRLASQAMLALNNRGSIIVNKQMQTSDPSIYAVGDAVETTNLVTGEKVFAPLAGPANKQARVAADHICGLTSSYHGVQNSSIVKFFDLVIATTGINEKTANRLGLDYDKMWTYSPSHATYYPGSQMLSIKTIYEKQTGRILGAQVVGFEGVDKRCDILATAIHFGTTAKQLGQLDLCYAPPFSSAKDPVNIAGNAISNVIDGLVKTYHWHQVPSLARDGSVTLLDTRTTEEYQNGHIEGYINIPLDELRSRLSELDNNKPIFVTCQIGLRGYVAARILTQHDFTAYNLSGGYKLYQTIYHDSEVMMPW